MMVITGKLLDEEVLLPLEKLDVGITSVPPQKSVRQLHPKQLSAKAHVLSFDPVEEQLLNITILIL